jgi:hypothetical protein
MTKGNYGITIDRNTTFELCGQKIRGSSQGCLELWPLSLVAYCIPCRIALKKK